MEYNNERLLLLVITLGIEEGSLVDADPFYPYDDDCPSKCLS